MMRMNKLVSKFGLFGGGAVARETRSVGRRARWLSNANAGANDDVKRIIHWGGAATDDGSVISTDGLQVVDVKHELSKGVVHVNLNRPDKMNALSMQLFEDLESAFKRIELARDNVKCVVLGGNGPGFCAGIDLQVLMSLKAVAESEKCPSKQRENMGRIIQRFQKICSLPETCHAPVIASIDGLCIGGGIDLATACDLRLCTDATKFSVKEVDLAIVADLGTLQRLPSIVGEQRARELAYTGRLFSGTEAKAMGLVLDSFSQRDEMDDEAAKLAHEIASKSAVTTRGIKKTMNFSKDHTVEEGLEYVLRWNTAHLLSKDLDDTAKELMKKFMKKA